MKAKTRIKVKTLIYAKYISISHTTKLRNWLLGGAEHRPITVPNKGLIGKSSILGISPSVFKSRNVVLISVT
nr:12900_t:CDS:2 [Entrophospora candida]